MPERVGTGGFTRRSGLRALALLGPAGLLAACTGSDEPTPAEPTPAASDAVVGGATAAEEAELIAQYDAVLASLTDASPQVVAVLSELRDQHAAHRDALGGSEVRPTPSPPPATLDAILGSLIDAERSASRSRIRACTEAGDPQTARLLVFIGASEASHVPALRELRP